MGTGETDSDDILTLEANSEVTVLAPLIPNLAAAPMVKPTVMAALRLVIISLITPGLKVWIVRGSV